MDLAAFVVVTVAMVIAGCSSPCPEDVSAFSDDPKGVRQWYLPALGAPDAWRVRRYIGEVIVAVIDNGFDLDHPDLTRRLWTNPNEQINGIDDDDNGYVDDVHGWDFLDNDPDAGLAAENGIDPALHGHGTSVAGIIGADTDNGIGVAACCPYCRLMLLRGRDFREAHNVMPVLAVAIRYAVDNGARVINISDGIPLDRLDPAVFLEVESAIAEANATGVVIIASAGNDAAESVRWPARLDQVVAVGAVDEQWRPTSWTSYGSEVNLSAPGQCIYTTVPDGKYGYIEGTSASAPIVAGLAAMLIAVHPEWTPEEVVARMKVTAKDVKFDTRPELEGLLGAGVVDFWGAVGE